MLKYRKEEMLKNLDLEKLPYRGFQFLASYEGDMVSAAKNAGVPDKGLKPRLTLFRKDEQMKEFMQEVDKIMAEEIEELVHETAKDVIIKMDIVKEGMDLSWCNQKQAHFLLCYNGSPVETARLVGYAKGGPEEDREARLRKAVHNLMRDERMKKAVAQLDQTLEERVVMSTVRAKILLTEFAENEDLDNKQRQSAITTILKTQGALTEKLIVESKGKIEHEHSVRPVFKHLSIGSIGRSLGLEDPDPDIIDIAPESIDDLI